MEEILTNKSSNQSVVLSVAQPNASSETSPVPDQTLSCVRFNSSNGQVFITPPIESIKQEEEPDDDDSTVTPTRLYYDDENGKVLTPSDIPKKSMLTPCNDEGKKRSYIITKVVKKKSKKHASHKIKMLINSLYADMVVNDTPMFSPTARVLKHSDVMFLELKEIELDEEEPRYNCFGYGKMIQLTKNEDDSDDEYKKNCACNECEYEDICDEYRFGSYCVASVERYYRENKFFVTTKDAYVVFVSHYNRALDFDSFNRHNESAGIRSSDVTSPPLCMKQGSLRHALTWVRWQIENGEEKAYHQEIKIRKKRAKKMYEVGEAAKFKYRYVRNKDTK